MVNLTLAAIAGAGMPDLSRPLSLLPLLLPLLNTLVLVAFLHVSCIAGWRVTRTFWITVISAMALAWVVGDLVPVLLTRDYPDWAVRLRWLGPVAVGLAYLAFFAKNGRHAAELWYPVAALVRDYNSAAVVVALALPLRIGLIAYGMPHGAHGAIKTRLQHVDAPADYASLDNPFLSPKYSVVLEQVGANSEAVLEIVQSAVANRNAARTDVLQHTPSVICEVLDYESANAIAERLRAAGATCSVRETLDVFLDQIKADTPTPIGRPSQVLDPEYLKTGRDAVAELRASLASEQTSEGAIDHQLLERAYIALTTAQGRAIYQMNCRPCHGTKGSGDGPAATGFSLRPANFRDPQGIAMLRPGEVLWRIEQGAAGLPPEATPWDSAMPAWKHELDRELIWKAILGVFDVANTRPALAGATEHRHHTPRAAPPARTVVVTGWLDWPVPPSPAPQEMQDPEFVKRGGYVYYYRCMPCHGVIGRGDGPAADTMWPRPRDFTTENFAIATPQPKFKFRTTKQGWLPTDQDLYRSISRGLTGTGMEGWDDVLSPTEIWQVIAYLKTLSPAWADPEHIARNPNDPVVVQEFTQFDGSPPQIDYAAMHPPPVTQELVAQGHDAFLRARCYECHGVEARGDGLALGQHYDDWGYRMWPQNLARAFNYKAGHAVKEIYRTFANRLDGTVMPVYSAKTLDQKDPQHGEHLLWSLALYVTSQVQTDGGAATSASIVIGNRVTDLPTDPLDPKWQRAPKTMVPLSGQAIAAPRWAAPAVSQVGIRVAVSSEAMAVWLQWDDRRPNVTHEDTLADFRMPDDPILGPATYSAPALKPKSPVIFAARDQLELQFPDAVDPAQWPRGLSPRAPLFYGSETAPAVLWRWSADRQGITVTKRAVEIAGSMTERLESTSEESAGHGRAIDFLRARGPASDLEPLPPQPPSTAMADWSNGAWTLVLSGLPPVSEAFARGESSLPLAIHIWDGLAGEADGRLAISSWIDVALPSPRPAWHHVLAAALALAVFVAELRMARAFRRQRARTPA